MGTFSDLSEIKQWGALLLAGVILTAALYFTVFKSQRDQNTQAQQQVETKLHENAELEAYRPKLAEMERQVASLKQQLDIERRIVPDEKQADDFIRADEPRYQSALEQLRANTDTRWSPWRTIDADDEQQAAVATLEAIADAWSKAMPSGPPQLVAHSG